MPDKALKIVEEEIAKVRRLLKGDNVLDSDNLLVALRSSIKARINNELLTVTECEYCGKPANGRFEVNEGKYSVNRNLCLDCKASTLN